METIYANSFSITTNDNQESFIVFRTDIPKYNEKNEFQEMESVKSCMIILNKDGYGSFRDMLDKAEEKDSKEENK